MLLGSCFSINMDPNCLNKLSQMVFYYIPTASRMTKIFQEWCTLDANERQFVDNMVLAPLDVEHVDLYKAIRAALVRWEIVQDTEGATGFNESTSIDQSFSDELNTLVLNIIKSLELAVLQMNGSKNCDTDDEMRTEATWITFRQLCTAKRELSTNSDEKLPSAEEAKDDQRTNVPRIRRTKSNSNLMCSPPRKLKRNQKNASRQVDNGKVQAWRSRTEYDTE